MSWGIVSRPVYVGANIPASEADVGQLIQVDNPAVPGGRSILRWTGALWAPPAGELIAMKWRDANPVALVTPGVTTQVLIWQSEIIPEYMIPDLGTFEISGGLSAKNAAGIAGCLVMLGMSSTPTVCSALAGSITPNATGVGIGVHGTYPSPAYTHSSVVTRVRSFAGFMVPVNGGQFPGNNQGVDIPGQIRAMAVAKPSSTTDQIQFDGIRIISRGSF